MLENTHLNAESSLFDWLKYLTSIHTSAIDLGLDRVALVANKGKLTKPAPMVITVAGTNGKGSTCAILESILQQAGYKTGVYSSPHLIRYNERVRINGKELADSKHTQAFAAIEALRENTSLSIFEFGTLAAFWLFIDNKVDVAILEVGLGGRLDATNVAKPDISVITSLAIDHVDWLGDDIEKIGFEKAGIFRPNKPAVCGQKKPPRSVSDHARQIQADLYQVDEAFFYQNNGSSWSWRCEDKQWLDLPIPHLPLANAATALMVIKLAKLMLSDEHIYSGIQQAKLAGRMQRVSQFPLILLDVAHNPHSATYLAKQLKIIKQESKIKIKAVVGMLKDKDIAATLSPMKDIVDEWYLASLQGERAADWHTLATFLPDQRRGFDSPVAAYKAAYEELVDQNQAIVVFGSFHTVGEIADYLSK